MKNQFPLRPPSKHLHPHLSRKIFALLAGLTGLVGLPPGLMPEAGRAQPPPAALPAPGAPGGKPSASQKPTSALAGINVLLVPLDAVDGKASVAPGILPVPAGATPATPPAAADVALDGDFAAQPPGAAQLAAAPLRRALLRRGLRDVLNASPDSAVMRRALNDRRISPRLLQAVETAMAQLVALAIVAEKSPPVGADAAGAAPAVPLPPPATAPPVAPPAETPAIILESTPPAGAPAAGAPPIAPEDAPPAQAETQEAMQAAREAVTQAAARLGQALDYRAVVLLAVIPAPAASLPSLTLNKTATYALLVADSLRGTGETVVFDEDGADTLKMNEDAAEVGGAAMQKILASWQALTIADRAQRIDDYLSAARAALQRGDAEAVRLAAGQALALDATRSEAHILMGDALQASEPVAAVTAYRRALGTQRGGDGALWAKIALAYANAKDWPSTLKAAGEALKARHDSAALRLAMATAQFGRATLFRAADRIERAEEAEFQAREHLDRARELTTDDPGVALNIARLHAEQLVARKQFREALRTLDVIAPQHPNDIRLQSAYAAALSERPGRGGEAFAVWARVWKLTGAQAVPFSARAYRRVAEGFDEYAADLAMRATRLTAEVANGRLPREAALLQIARLAEDMDRAAEAVKIMMPAGRNADAIHAARLFAADLLDQAFDQHRVYLETGDDAYRARAIDLHRQAVLQLNSARGND